MVEDNLDSDRALRRAAQTLRMRLPQPPPAELLRDAVREYRSLFRPGQADELKRQRELARQAMRALDVFRPRLYGGLATGSGPLAPIRLMLFADTPEQVMLTLADRHIPWRETTVTLLYAGGRRQPQPGLSFEAGDSSVELVVLPPQSRSDPPRDPVDGGRLVTLDLAGLERLLDPD